MSKGVRRVAGRIRVSYNQRERLSSAFRGTGLGRRVMKNGRNQVTFVSCNMAGVARTLLQTIQLQREVLL